MKIGSLCTGYGGLDMAVEAYFDAETIWCAEIDKQASQLIKNRFDITNHGDIKSIDWSSVEPVDILTAGYPCQPFSVAGNRQGSNDARHLWPYIKEAISVLRPRWVVLENVRGHLSLGFKEVLKDLAEVGYDARWQIVRASDVGAPHQRARLFIVAHPKSEGSRRQTDGLQRQSGQSGRDISSITNSNCDACKEPRQANSCIHEKASKIFDWANRNEYGNSLKTNADTNDPRGVGAMSRFQGRFNSCSQMSMQTPADPLDSKGKLNPAFVEYMMGLPVGWVTDMDMSRTQQLKMLGNGVVPQQAYYALQLLLNSDTPSEQDLCQCP